MAWSDEVASAGEPEASTDRGERLGHRLVQAQKLPHLSLPLLVRSARHSKVPEGHLYVMSMRDVDRPVQRSHLACVRYEMVSAKADGELDPEPRPLSSAFSSLHHQDPIEDVSSTSSGANHLLAAMGGCPTTQNRASH